MTKLQTDSPRVNPDEEAIFVGPLGVRFLLTGDHSSGSIAIFEMTVPAGKRLPAPTHSNEHFEETLYGISGVLTVMVDGTTVLVGPGQAVCIPRGAVHRFDNETAEDVVTLSIITPATIGPEYFREMAELLEAAGAGPPD